MQAELLLRWTSRRDAVACRALMVGGSLRGDASPRWRARCLCRSACSHVQCSLSRVAQCGSVVSWTVCRTSGAAPKLRPPDQLLQLERRRSCGNDLPTQAVHALERKHLARSLAVGDAVRLASKRRAAGAESTTTVARSRAARRSRSTARVTPPAGRRSPRRRLWR